MRGAIPGGPGGGVRGRLRGGSVTRRRGGVAARLCRRGHGPLARTRLPRGQQFTVDGRFGRASDMAGRSSGNLGDSGWSGAARPTPRMQHLMACGRSWVVRDPTGAARRDHDRAEGLSRHPDEDRRRSSWAMRTYARSSRPSAGFRSGLAPMRPPSRTASSRHTYNNILHRIGQTLNRPAPGDDDVPCRGQGRGPRRPLWVASGRVLLVGSRARGEAPVRPRRRGVPRAAGRQVVELDRLADLRAATSRRPWA